MTHPGAEEPLAELAAQYHHRLLSLEADLKDKARAGGLTPAAFAKRVRRLKEVHQAMAALRGDDDKAAADIGLPLSGTCTPAEDAVVAQFLDEREKTLGALARETAQVHEWITDAASGKAGPLRGTLRLSKLRSILQAHEAEAAAHEVEARALDAQAEGLLAQLGGGHGREAGRTALTSLMTLFQRLEGTTSRVAKLKAAVNRDERKAARMEAWLAQHEAQVAQAQFREAPPTPMAIAEATRSLPRGPVAKSLGRAARRKDLVERFWSDVLERKA